MTEQSLDWLPLSRLRDANPRPELRYARFTLLSIGSSSCNDLDAAPTIRSGLPAVVARRVCLRASGELELQVRARWLAERAAAAPSSGAPGAAAVLDLR